MDDLLAAAEKADDELQANESGIVWAKRDEHTWWPAKIISRRAVPSEVGPPPGGASVLSHRGVAFFSVNGIQEDRPFRSLSSLLAAALWQHRSKSELNDGAKRKIAWVPLDSTRPFKAAMTPEGSSTEGSGSDLFLAIAAAEAEVERIQNAASKGVKAQESEPADESEGGWGVSSIAYRLQVAKSRTRTYSLTSVASNVGDSLNDTQASSERDALSQASNSSADLIPSAVGSKRHVESIVGWRSAPNASEASAQEKQREAADDERARVLQEAIDLIASSEDQGRFTLPQTLSTFSIRQLAEGGDYWPSPFPSPSDARQFLVKWRRQSHIHDSWLDEATLSSLCPKRLANFKRRHGTQPCLLVKPEWILPEKLLTRRPCPSGPGWEVLVKWTNLGYDSCSWEAEDEPVLLRPEHIMLHRDMWQRSEKAAAAATTRGSQAEVTRGPLVDLVEQPSYVGPSEGAHLFPHQLQAVNWLRKQWVQGSLGSVLADDPGMGKTATVVAFLQVLLHEFKVTHPLLVVAPQSVIDFWEGEWNFWAQGEAGSGPSDFNMVVYSGSSLSRAVAVEHDMFSSPLDDHKQTLKAPAAATTRVPSVDVIFASYESLVNDPGPLASMHFDAVVLDLRVRPSVSRTGSSARPHPAKLLETFQCRHRLVLLSSPLPGSTSFGSISAPPTPEHVEELRSIASFILSEGSLTSSRDDSSSLSLLRTSLSPFVLRRLACEVERTVDARSEVTVALEMTPTQGDSYASLLARRYESLAGDAKDLQSRASRLRSVLGDLRKVSSHPSLVPELEPDLATAAAAEGGGDLAASGKLQLLERLLKQLDATGKRALLLSHSSKMLDLVQALARARGASSVSRIDATTRSRDRNDAVQAFNQPDSLVKVFLMTVRSCGLGTNLPGVELVIFLDSDWHPQLDLLALRRAYCVGRKGELKVVRVFTQGTVEERLSRLATSPHLVGKLCGSESSSSSSSAELLETIVAPSTATRSCSPASSVSVLDYLIKWGASKLFAQSQGDAGSGAGPMSIDPPPASSAEYSDKDLVTILQVPPPIVSEEGQEGQPATEEPIPLPSSIEGGASVKLRTWLDVDGPLSYVRRDPEGDGEGLTAEDLAGHSCSFWSSLLKSRWEEIQAEDSSRCLSREFAEKEASAEDEAAEEAEVKAVEEELAAAQALLGPLLGVSAPQPPTLTLGGPMGHLESLPPPSGPGRGMLLVGGGRPSLATPATLITGALGKGGGAVSLPGATQAPQGGGAVAQGGRGGGGRGSANPTLTIPSLGVPGGRGSSAQLPASITVGGRGSGASGGGRGGGAKSKRSEDHDDPTYVGGAPEERGGGAKRRKQAKAADRGDDFGLPAAPIPPSGILLPPAPMILPQGPLLQLGGIQPSVQGSGLEGLVPSPRHLRDLLMLEVSRMEVVKQALADPSTLEYGVASRASLRMRQICAGLFPEGTVPAQEAEGEGAEGGAAAAAAASGDSVATTVAEMAHQVADILIMMRHEEEAPSDFQDYTLVAIVAVAAHLLKQPLGEEHGLKKLAEKHGHDVTSLDQVFWHIVTRLSYFRELHIRSQSSGDDGRSFMDSSKDHHLQQVVISEVDSFANRLNSILASDMSAIVYAQVSQENIPLGPLATLMPLLQMAGVLNDNNIKNALKQVRECQEQLVILDRTHSFKVQQIQKEYQDFMERVRTKAQTAIDSANREYQGAKNLLSSRMGIMVDYLQAQIPMQQLQQAAQQMQRVAQQAAVQQSGLLAAVLNASVQAQQPPAQPQPQPAPGAPSALEAEAANGTLPPAELPAATNAAPPAQAEPKLTASSAAIPSWPMLLPPQPAPTLAELVQAIALGRVSLDQVPEPLRGQLALVFTQPAAAAAAAAAAARQATLANNGPSAPPAADGPAALEAPAPQAIVEEAPAPE